MSDFNKKVAAKLSTLRSVSAVVKLAGSIKTRAANLDIDMHAAGCGALFCAMTFKDTSAAAAVINSLGKHTRAKAFAEWVERYSNVLLVLDKKTGLWSGKMVPAEDRADDAKLAEMLAEAQEQPFWTPEEKSARDFSLHAALAMLLKKGQQARDKGKLSDEDKLALVEVEALTAKLAPVADKLETVG